MGATVGVGVGVGSGFTRAHGIGRAGFTGGPTSGVGGGSLWGGLAGPLLLTVRPNSSPELATTDNADGVLLFGGKWRISWYI